MSYVLGLTGPTGSGKSTASKYLKDLGYRVINCDEVSRKAILLPDAVAALTSAFGKGILLPDGSVSRKALAEKAFVSTDKTELLNKTFLPFVVGLIKEKIKGDKVVLDAPTLYESGLDSLCNKVIVITADKQTRIKRIMARDNIDLDSALLRINAGKENSYYKAKTEHIIYNDKSETELLASIDSILGGI